MTANPINHLNSLGLIITLDNNQFIIKPTHLVTQEIIAYIKQHKGTLKSQLLAASQHVRKLPQLTDLTPQQNQWLNRIAHHLNTTPAFLLEHQLIDQFDVVELVDKESLIVANCIKTNPKWTNIEKP